MSVYNMPISSLPFFVFSFVCLKDCFLSWMVGENNSQSIAFVNFSLLLQVEPSPTTGSFAKPQMIHGSVGSSMFSSTSNCSNSNTFDERKSGSFEFKPHTVSNSASGLFLVGSPVMSS